MSINNKIMQAIYAAIDRTNELMPKGQKMEKSINTLLFDKEGFLDSLGLVNFIVAAEEITEDLFGRALNLSSAIDDLKNENHLRTVGTFAVFIEKRLQESDRNGK